MTIVFSFCSRLARRCSEVSFFFCLGTFVFFFDLVHLSPVISPDLAMCRERAAGILQIQCPLAKFGRSAGVESGNRFGAYHEK